MFDAPVGAHRQYPGPAVMRSPNTGYDQRVRAPKSISTQIAGAK
jgi:hypothetical protein